MENNSATGARCTAMDRAKPTIKAPMGPQPVTSTRLPNKGPARRTACKATDRGSAIAASLAGAGVEVLATELYGNAKLSRDETLARLAPPQEDLASRDAAPEVLHLVDAADGGCVLFSARRPGSTNLRCLPAAGRPWVLGDVVDAIEKVIRHQGEHRGERHDQGVRRAQRGGHRTAHRRQVAVGQMQADQGRMGGGRITQRGLTVVEVIAGDNLLLVRGSVPGPRGSTVEVRTDA